MVKRIGGWIWAGIVAVGAAILMLLGLRRLNEGRRIDEAEDRADSERARLRAAVKEGDEAVIAEWRRHRR